MTESPKRPSSARAGAHVSGATLQERLDFETLLSELSTTFINLPADRVDHEIVHGLESIVRALRAERGVISKFEPLRNELRVTHVWAVEGIDRPEPVTLDADKSPLLQFVMSGSIFAFSSIEELERESTKEFFRAYGTKSHITVPLLVGGEFIGTLSLATITKERAWPDAIVQRLTLVGQCFANAIARARSERKRNTLERELEHSSRITAVGELAAGLAHELKQPLTAILSNAQAARRFLSTGDEGNLDEVREILDDIVKDDERAVAVMDRLRDFMRKSSIKTTMLDLNDVIGDVVSLVSSDLTAKNIDVREELDTSLPEVPGDRTQLQQVLLNLFMNASEAMAAVDPGKRRLTIRTSAADDGVLVQVSDTGIGLDEDTLVNLFEHFFTTKRDGMGIGLAINHSIISAHGGRVWADTNPDGGATFSFTLPYEQGDPS